MELVAQCTRFVHTRCYNADWSVQRGTRVACAIVTTSQRQTSMSWNGRRNMRHRPTLLSTCRRTGRVQVHWSTSCTRPGTGRPVTVCILVLQSAASWRWADEVFTRPCQCGSCHRQVRHTHPRWGQRAQSARMYYTLLTSWHCTLLQCALIS